MILLPVVVAYQLRKHDWANSIISLASFVLTALLLVYSFSLWGYDPYVFVGHMIWLVPASWVLVFGLYALTGKGRIIAYISLSLTVAMFIVLSWLA